MLKIEHQELPYLLCLKIKRLVPDGKKTIHELSKETENER